MVFLELFSVKGLSHEMDLAFDDIIVTLKPKQKRGNFNSSTQ